MAITNLTTRELTAGITITVKQGQVLPFLPRWEISTASILCSSEATLTNREDLNANSYGSGVWLWSSNDTMRFSPQDGLLQTLIVHVPERAFVWPAFHDFLATSPFVIGLPQLNILKNFGLESARYRSVDRDRFTLVGFFDERINLGGSGLRVRVATDFGLFFLENKLCGWILYNAAKYVVAAGGEVFPGEPTEAFKSVLIEYLDLVEDRNIEAMEEKDPVLEKRLRELRDKASVLNVDVDRCKVIVSQVSKVLDTFYG